MRVLIIGSGGREHALAWKLRQSPSVTELFIAPGNGGTAQEGINLPIGDGDVPALMEFIRQKEIDFVVPGPELPLVLGIVDACRKAGVPCFGPDKFAAQLEGSKAFAKEIMSAAGVPTAQYAVFTKLEEARAYVQAHPGPIVVKADGLAAGKGVVVAADTDEALLALDHMLGHGAFGQAGSRVVIEEKLVGEEVSLLCFCDGEDYLPLPPAQDHKAAFDGDSGPNTGGMGAYSPAPVLPDSQVEEVARIVIRPILREMAKRGHPFTGILYAGLMMTAEGPRVVEYNVRFGDPECQPLLMRLQGDILAIMRACVDGRLEDVTLSVSEEHALCVVVAAEGYPGEYAKGMQIGAMARAEATAPGRVKVFQAGTKLEKGQVVSSGGRVLGVTALGVTLAQAQERAYQAVDVLEMEGMRCRRDIGWKALR